jgi:DNA repair protein SbcD/Mre11
MEVLDFPENVFRFQSDAIQKITYCKDGRPLADIYGMSYQDKAITQNISYQYKIEEARSLFSIAMLHGNLTGNTTHDNYAPFTLLDLQNTQFDYWALGHVHTRQVLSDKFPVIVYPGNPQGRDFGERSSKGCYLVELTTNENPKFTFISTQSIRFEEVPIDLSGLREFTSLSDAITNGIDDELSNEDSIIRIILTGRTPLHSQLQSDQNSLLEHLNSDAFVRSPFRLIDRIHVNTSPETDFEQLKQAGDFAGELIKEFDQVQENIDTNEWFSSITNEIANAQIRRELSSLSEDEKKQVIEDAKYDLLDQFINE